MGTVDKLMDGLILAADGTGPLLQRDYWAVIANCGCSPREVARRLAEEFETFAPEELVRFARDGQGSGGLAAGEELNVAIRMAGDCRVRVLHRDENSLTLGTLDGHPEAGRITFGAYRNRDGDVVFHIRSRAKASSRVNYAGYVAAGEAMQTTTWSDFVRNVAARFGDGVVGVIHVETKPVEDEPEDPETSCSPTFLARGD